jgi:hypothetical protein
LLFSAPVRLELEAMRRGAAGTNRSKPSMSRTTSASLAGRDLLNVLQELMKGIADPDIPGAGSRAKGAGLSWHR